MIQARSPNHASHDVTLAGEDDRLTFADLKAERALEPVYLEAVLDIHDCDPVAYRFFHLARPWLALAIDDDFPVDGRRDDDRAKKIME